MIYTGIIQNEKNQPLQNATLKFLDPAGRVIVSYPVHNGRYSIDSVMDSGLLEYGNSAKFEAPGYGYYFTDASNLQQTYTVTLTAKANNQAGLYFALAATAIALAPNKKKSVSGIADRAKELPVLTGVLAVGLGIVLYKMFFAPDPDKKDQAGGVNAANAELIKLAQQGIKPTISNGQAQTFADVIFGAVDECGTDEGAIFNVFSYLSNEADLQLLIKTYGVRPVRGCFDGSYATDTLRNLATSLQKDLSTSEINEVNAIMHGNGINYKF